MKNIIYLAFLSFTFIVCSKEDSQQGYIIKSLKIDNPIDTIVIFQKHKFKVTGTNNTGTTVDLTNQATVSSLDSIIKILDDNSIFGTMSGKAKVQIKYKDLMLTKDIYVNYFEEVLNKVSPYLRENNSSADINVPVVIINFHPTLDGISIDPRRYLDDYFIKDRYFSYYGLDRNVCDNVDKNNQYCKTGSLEMHKIRGQDLHSLTKFGIEEGSKFRGFVNSNSKKTINIEVVKYFNFYELKTKVYPTYSVPQPDYQILFQLINLEYLVNQTGVKEVWICVPPLSIEYPAIQQGLISKDLLLNLPESNMSGPYGDVSNSSRNESDLPKYNNTYVVYGVNLDRGPSEALHNRGHQIESQLRFIERDKRSGNELFWNMFVGFGSNNKPLGRCGATHFPPNTSIDYDYCNTNLVESDINDWIPAGGTKVKVNCDTWTKKQYSFPPNIFWNNKADNAENDAGYKWFIYWFQSFPNKNSNIQYNLNGQSKLLANWWELFYNWDESLKNKKTLWLD